MDWDWGTTAAMLAAKTHRHWDYDALRVALLQTRPFKDCCQDHIWDISTPPVRPVPCQNWSSLVTELAVFLILYADILRATVDVVPQEAARRTYLSLVHLEDMCAFVMDLKKRRVLSAEARVATRNIHQSAIDKALALLRTVAESPTPADHRFTKRIFRRRIETVPLVQQMYDIFSRSGPHASDFSEAAKYIAIAAILCPLGIEHGSVSQVAIRLHKRATRAPKPQQD